MRLLSYHSGVKVPCNIGHLKSVEISGSVVSWPSGPEETFVQYVSAARLVFFGRHCSDRLVAGGIYLVHRSDMRPAVFRERLGLTSSHHG